MKIVPEMSQSKLIDLYISPEHLADIANWKVYENNNVPPVYYPDPIPTKAEYEAMMVELSKREMEQLNQGEPCQNDPSQ